MRSQNNLDPGARRTVLLLNLILLAFVAAGWMLYGIATDQRLLLPTLVFAIWCAVVQYAIGRPTTAAGIARRRRWWRNAAVGAVSGGLMFLLIGWPIYGWLTR